jgi:hypothetical protein
LTTAEIARLFKARRSGTHKGRKAYQGRCPCHDDRMASLSVTEPERGRSKVNCFAGCDDVVVLSSKGLTVGDLYADKRAITPEIRRRWADEDRLKLLELQHGLAIMAQAVLPGELRYWQTVERNISVKGRALRDKLYPSEKEQRRREHETQRVIAEYGFEELWACLPIARLQARMMNERKGYIVP